MPRRNLLIVLPHALRSDAISDERAWPLTTPNFENIAARGMRLVATSACPADPGGMVSLLTGMHARQHGLAHTASAHPGEPPEAYRLHDALPHWLSRAGYHVAGVGCIDPIRDALADGVRVAPPESDDPGDCAYLQAMRANGLAEALLAQRGRCRRSGPCEPDRLLLDPEDDIDGFIASKAQAMLQRMPADRPWALFVMLSGPGNDLPPATLYEGLVNPAGLEAGFTPLDPRTVDVLAEPQLPRSLLQRLEPNTVARIRADYLGRVGMLDHSLGKLDQAMRQRGDSERNWLVVASDRGHLLGEQGLLGGRSLLNGAIETPLLVAPTSKRPQQDEPLWYDELVSAVDVSATIAALAGCDMPPAATGRSLLPIFNGDPVTPTATGLISEFNHRLMLTTERHKVVFDSEKRSAISMIDLLTDPFERGNLVGHPAGANLIDGLRWRLADVLMPLRAAPAGPAAGAHVEATL